MSGRLRLLDLVKPFLPILPEVEVPLQRVPYDEKLVWTVMSGLAFFVLSEVSIYGVKEGTTAYDPLFWLRPVLASTQGSVLELGTSPLLTAGLVLQLLGGIQLIDVNFEFQQDRELFQSAQKLLAIVLTFLQALALVFSGIYGAPTDLGVGGIVLILSQLVLAGLFVIYVDEILQKGYGWGTGVAFFTTLHIAQSVFWRLLSLSTQDTGRGKEFVGAFVALVHLAWTRRSFTEAFYEAFYRTHLPNMFELYTSVGVFALTVYLLAMKVDIPIKSTKARSPASSYPIRLLHTGNVPLLFVAALTSNILLWSLVLFRQFPDNLFVNLLGTWEVRTGTNHLVATSGLVYYLQPPFSIVEALWDPIRTAIYAAVVVGTSVVVARTWAEHSGGSARDVAKLFKSQDIVIVGHRDVSAVKELKKIIPPAASVGGAILGLLSVASGVTGGGNGTAILVGVNFVYAYFEILAAEGGLPGFAPGS